MKCKIFTVAALVTVAAALYGQTRSITATKAYVDRRYADATNAVPSIVTNEVTVGFTEWSFSAHDSYAPRVWVKAIHSMEWVETGSVDHCTFPSWRCEATTEATGPDGTLRDFTGVYYSGFYGSAKPVDATSVRLALDPACDSWLIATRSRITRNALGLAMLKDLEALPDHEDVTNTARNVVNTVWDAKLGVAWEARMHDGHLYYIAVTNAPGGAE